MTDTDTLQQIHALSEERQQLWRLAAKKKLTPEQWERCFRIIPKQLEQLWHVHRNDLAIASKPQKPTRDSVSKALFDDYLDPMRVGQQEVNPDELNGFTIKDMPVFDHSRTQRKYSLVNCDAGFITISAELFREVLAELRQRDRAQRHNMTLRELRTHQRRVAS